MNSPSFSKNAIIYLLGGVVAAGGNVLLAPMYLRLLSADDYGAWSQFNLMLQFLQPIMCWGLLAAMARLLADSDYDARKRKIGAAIKMVTALNVALLLVIVGITQQRFTQSLVSDQKLNLLRFAAVAAALAAYPNILMGVYVADSKALRYRSMNVVGFILQVAVLGACASLFLMDVQIAIMAMIAAASVYAGLSAYQLVHAVRWNAGASEYKALLSFGGPIVLYTIAGQISDFTTRSVLAATVTGADFGAFSAGMIYASVVAMLSSAINLAWVPLYYRHAQDWMTSGIYRQFVDVFTAVAAACGAFLIIFSDELLSLYSGGQVSLQASTVGVFVIISWLNSAIWMSLANPLFQQKRSKTVLVIVFLAIAASLPPALFFISRYGVLGASISLLFNALVLCLSAAIALRQLGIPSLNYSKIALDFFLLIFISSPLMNFLYYESPGSQRLAEKFLLITAFVVVSLVPVVRPAINLLRVIESDVAR